MLFFLHWKLWKTISCSKKVRNVTFWTPYICKRQKQLIDWFIDYLLFYVPLKNFSLIWRRHYYRWRAAEFRPMLGAHSLWAGRDLYRATPTVTRDLGSSGLIRRTAHLVASYDKHGNAEDPWHLILPLIYSEVRYAHSLICFPFGLMRLNTVRYFCHDLLTRKSTVITNMIYVDSTNFLQSNKVVIRRNQKHEKETMCLTSACWVVSRFREWIRNYGSDDHTYVTNLISVMMRNCIGLSFICFTQRMERLILLRQFHALFSFTNVLSNNLSRKI
jgi:hypothetical protein